MVVEEPFFCRKCAYSDNPLEELTEIGEDWTSGICFHTPQVASGVKISNSEVVVQEPNKGSWEDEEWEYDTTYNES